MSFFEDSYRGMPNVQMVHLVGSLLSGNATYVTTNAPAAANGTSNSSSSSSSNSSSIQSAELPSNLTTYVGNVATKSGKPICRCGAFADSRQHPHGALREAWSRDWMEGRVAHGRGLCQTPRSICWLDPRL